MFVDPWGLAFSFDSWKNLVYFQEQMYAIYGTEDLQFNCEKQGNEIILNEIVGGDFGNGSETGASLLNNLIADEEKYRFYFDSTSDGGGTGQGSPIRIGLLAENGEDSFASKQEIQSRIIHECVHKYTDTRGYDNLISRGLRWDIGLTQTQISQIKRWYQEATAIYIEGIFRLDMGYEKRDVGKWGGIGTDKSSYGVWPWNVSAIYGKQVFKDDFTITPRESFLMWTNIVEEAKGIK